MTHRKNESIRIGSAIIIYDQMKGVWIIPFQKKDKDGIWRTKMEVSKIRATEAAKLINQAIKRSNKEVQLELEVDA